MKEDNEKCFKKYKATDKAVWTRYPAGDSEGEIYLRNHQNNIAYYLNKERRCTEYITN